MSRPPIYRSILERLRANSIRTSCGCLLHLGTEHNGYVKISIRIPGEKKPKARWVHRLAYQAYHPETDLSLMEHAGKVVAHTCHNRACWARRHLTLKTQSANIMDNVRRGTHRTPFRKYLNSLGLDE